MKRPQSQLGRRRRQRSDGLFKEGSEHAPRLEELGIVEQLGLTAVVLLQLLIQGLVGRLNVVRGLRLRQIHHTL